MRSLITGYRNMTIEEVSVLFDTGRRGDANAAVSRLGHSEQKKELSVDWDDEKGAKKSVAHVE